MPVVTTENKFRFDNVEEAVGVVVNMPLHSAMELHVVYGEAGIEALLNVDYTILLNESDYSNFTFTPLESLIDKIDAQVVAEPTDRNTVLLVRLLPYTTPATSASARDTNFVAREFERTMLRFQQVDEQLSRALVTGINSEETGYDLTLPSWVADKIIAWHPSLKKLVTTSLSISDITGLGDLAGYVAQAEAAAVAAVAAQGIAVNAKDDAEDAADIAVAAQAAASTSASDASTAAANSLADRVLAQAAKVAAEAAEATASAAASSASAGATDAENAKIATEAAQAVVEALVDAFSDSWLGAHATEPTLDSDGSPLEEGDLFWNSTTNQFGAYDLSGTAWVYLASGGAASLITFSPTGGLSAINVQAALAELDTEKFNTSDVDVDGTLAANSDAKVASQKATKTYVDGRFTALLNGVSSAFDTLAEIATAIGVITANNWVTTVRILDGAVTYAKLAAAAIMSAGNWRAGTADKLMTPALVWADSQPVAVAFANPLPFNAASWAGMAETVLSGNTVFDDPTGFKGIQHFVWKFTATGADRTLTLHADFKPVDGVPTFPITVTTTKTTYVCGFYESANVVVITAVLRRS